MRKYLKYIVMITICISMYSTPANAAWCKGRIPLYKCMFDTIDLAFKEFVQKIKNTLGYKGEAAEKAANATKAVEAKKTVAENPKPDAPVPDLNLGPSAPAVNNPILKTVKPTEEAPSIGAGASQDLTGAMVVQMNFIKGDPATYLKNRDKFFISSILQAASIHYDTMMKIEDIKLKINEIAKASEKDSSKEENMKFNFALKNLDMMIRQQRLKVKSANMLLDVSQMIYASPDVGADPSSTSQLGKGDTEGRTGY